MSKNTSKTAGVAKAATSNSLMILNPDEFDENKVPQYIAEAEAKLAELKGDNSSAKRIDAELDHFGSVKEMKDPATIIAAYGYINRKSELFTKDAEEVFQGLAPSIKVPAFKENGFTAAQWSEELKMQYKSTVFEKEVAKLQRIIEKFKTLLSENDKKRQSLRELAKELSGEE